MNFGTRIDDFVARQIVHVMEGLLNRWSDKNLLKLTHLGEMLTSDESVLADIAGVRRYLQDPQHPTRQLFRRVLDYLPSKNSRALFETFFYRELFLGNKKREEFEKKNGYWPPFVMILSPTLHCNLRCKGCYTLDYLREVRVLIGSSATVTAENVQTVASDSFVDFMIEKGSFAQMYFLYIPVNGNADFSLMVTPEQRDYLRRQVIHFRATRPMFFLDFWNDGPHVEGCIAGGRRYFHLSAKGDVEPCVYTHVAVDNIRDTTLAKALDSPLFRSIRRKQPHNSNHLRPCMIIGPSWIISVSALAVFRRAASSASTPRTGAT